MKTAPFWQEDLTEKLMAGILKPEDVVENWIELTSEELEIRNKRVSDPSNKYYTIYEQIPSEYLSAFQKTCFAVMRIELETGIDFIVSSFFRSLPHHLRVYAAKGITDQSKIPMKSTHLRCEGIDLVPKNRSIKEVHALFNEEFLEKHNLWMEHEKHTPTWAHLQIVQYPSWKPGNPRKYFI